jgi:hypothetical protein
MGSRLGMVDSGTTKENSGMAQAIPSQLINSATTVNGTGFDRTGFNDILFTQNIGAASGTTPTLDTKIQESDELATGYTDIAAAAYESGAVPTQKTDADANTSTSFGVKATGLKAFLREVVTTGGTPSFQYGSDGIKSGAHRFPVA